MIGHSESFWQFWKENLRVIDRSDGKEKSMHELWEKFYDDHPEFIEELRKAYEESDAALKRMFRPEDRYKDPPER
jgi:hypothetical protein